MRLSPFLLSDDSGAQVRINFPARPRAHFQDRQVQTPGLFLGPDARFSKIPGVFAVEVGYTGGKSPNPTYGRNKWFGGLVRIGETVHKTRLPTNAAPFPLC